MRGRFLCVNMNYIGDALMTTPALERLHAATGLPVDLIASPAALEVLRGNPSVGKTIERVASGSVGRCAQLFREIRTGRYKQVAILPSIPVYRSTAIAAGATTILYVPQLLGRNHLATHMARYTEQFLGLSQTPVELKLSVDPSTKRWAKNVLAGIDGSGPVVALNIGASRPQKRWPLSYFVECARMLIANGARILLLGGKPESAEADQIALQVDSASLLNQTGRTTLAEMIGLIAVSDALVTGDTAALHIGTALNTPLVALFGSTDPDQTGPLPGENRVVLYDRLQCSPCRSRPTCAGRFDCMKSLSPQRAAQAVESLLIQQAPVGVGQSKK